MPVALFELVSILKCWSPELKLYGELSKFSRRFRVRFTIGLQCRFMWRGRSRNLGIRSSIYVARFRDFGIDPELDDCTHCLWRRGVEILRFELDLCGELSKSRCPKRDLICGELSKSKIWHRIPEFDCEVSQSWCSGLDSCGEVSTS